jgi:hypothetical protein
MRDEIWEGLSYNMHGTDGVVDINFQFTGGFAIGQTIGQKPSRFTSSAMIHI